MNGFRGVGVLAVGLIWLAAVLGCTDNGAKPNKVASAEVPEDNIETVTADDPVADEPRSTVIPLNKIWANQIPGTQSINLLEQDFFGPTGEKIHGSPLVSQIVMALANQFDVNQPTGPGFAVAGTGHEALAAAKGILEQDTIPSQIFAAGTEISLFFYSDISRLGLQLRDVKQTKETVTIRYHYPWVDPLRPIDGTGHIYFALIPVGKPAAGKVAVNIIDSPPRNKNDRLTYNYQSSEQSICQSFTFAIEPKDTKTDINE